MTGRLRWLGARAAACLLLLFLLLPPPAAQAQENPGAWLVEPNNDDEVVYVDPQGFVRVYDPAGNPPIAFASPQGGWEIVALGDFTGEGDKEIVAIGASGPGGRLVIYDPVVASGTVDADQQFNGVPWKQLYSVDLPYVPRLVAVGEFDPNVAGQEIAYTTDGPPTGAGDATSIITVLAQSANPPDGTAWRVLATQTSKQAWSDISTGDLALEGIDQIVVIDEDRGTLNAFRLVNGSLDLFYELSSSSRAWSDSAIGHVDPATAQPELVLVRHADRPLASLVVLRYEAPDKFVDVYLRDFAPSPRVVFLADINVTGEEEIFMLRNVTRTAGCPPPYNTAPFQLIMRNGGPDRPPAFEVCLDQTNSFRYGAGGDLNGDGRDEVIVISAAQLRIFSNVDSSYSVANVAVSSNARTIAAGNLDKAGAVKPNTLAVQPETLVFSVAAGARSDPKTLQLSNSGTAGTPFPLVVNVLPQTPFVRWTLSSPQTPATLSVVVDAAELLPGLTYAAELRIDSFGVSVTNTPYRVPILIEVKDGLVVRPHAANVLFLDCKDQPAHQFELKVLGSPGITYRAVVDGVSLAEQPAEEDVAPAPQETDVRSWPVRDASWISSAQSVTNTVPSSITLTFDTSRAAPLNQARVTVTGQSGAATYTRTADITLLCTENPLYLPHVAQSLLPR